jgi:hypothetical protein
MVLVVINNFLTCQVLPHLTEIGESSARGEDTDERVLELYYDLAMVLDMLTEIPFFHSKDPRSDEACLRRRETAEGERLIVQSKKGSFHG